MADTTVRRGLGLGLRHLAYAVIAFIFVLPLWWAIVSSLRPNGEVFADIFPFTTKALLPSPLGVDLLLGIRPEHFSPSGSVRLGVMVDLVEHLGGASYAYGQSGGAQPLTIELRDSRSVAAGARLDIGFDPARAFLFDAVGGGRLR